MQPENQPNPQVQQPYQQPGAPAPGSAPEFQAASQAKHDHSKLFLILFIVATLLFIGTAGFGVWAFLERNEYKNETDAIVAQEVGQAVEENTAQLEAEFTEREKEPLTSYTSPAAYGGVKIEYPKTWSAYVKESDRGSRPVEGYFHPNFVPDENGGTLIALKIEVTNTSYQQSLRKFESAARNERVTITPIKAKNVDGVLGSRVDGEISSGVQGSVVLFELRDKTLTLTTESTEFLKDFDNIILANLSFNP